jgi:hypothetical protein
VTEEDHEGQSRRYVRAALFNCLRRTLTARVEYFSRVAVTRSVTEKESSHSGVRSLLFVQIWKVMANKSVACR